MKIVTSMLLVAALLAGSYIFAQQREPQPDSEREQLMKLSEFFHQRNQKRMTEVEKLSLENGWSVKSVSNERESKVIYIDDFGLPQAYATSNLNAAQTTGTNQLWSGGSLGLNLTGNTHTIGIWDGGGVRTTHQEFGSRVTILDGAALSNHGTHVGGTMAASGVQNAARGMAGSVTLRSYEWTNDYSEMGTEAASGLILSNHSYGFLRGWEWGSWSGNTGWHWWGNTGISTTEDYLFGFYDSEAQAIDQVAEAAPNYLIVWAAGNNRNDNNTGSHWVRSGANWVSSSASRDRDGGADGFDCIYQNAVAKNILSIGAVNDIPGGWTASGDVVMSDFSGWGPTDDGRIKPDIVANGIDLYSASSSGNTSYTTMSGTSMASPNTTGTLALLQEHYRNGRGGTMSAAALKGLVINTANEAGPSEGPDYMFGWGLLNAVGAANLISDDNTDGGLIVQGLLINGQTKDYTYYSDGSPISVVLSWTDPAGTPPAASLNPSTLMLVNNLNLRVIGTSTHSPWRLNPASPAAAATRGDNTRDNVEKVTVTTPTPGFYTIRVSHGGALSGGQQAYALIINGLSTPPNRTYCNARSSNFNSFEQINRVQYGSIDNRSQRSPGGYSNYTGLLTSVNKGSSQTITVTLAGGAASTWGWVYVDWNQDGDFNDAGEFYELGSGAGPTYSATISVPAGAYGGYTTMRVRIGWSGTPSACGTASYGETEDYTIKVNGTAGLWTGIYSTSWFDMYNWDDANVPTASTNVTIGTPVSFQPNVPSSFLSVNVANCNNLTIQSGGVLSMSGGSIVSSSVLNVYGNLNSDMGQFIMNGSYSNLYFRGTTNTNWDDDNENDTYTNIRVQKDAPTAILSIWQNMICSGTFYIIEGIVQLDPNWTLTIQSTSTNAFRVEDGGTIRLSGTRTIDVAGRIYFMDGSKTEITGGTLKTRGNVRIDSNTANDIALTGANLIFEGSGNQYIEDDDGGTLQLHHLTIDKTGGTVFINGAALNINGDLLINNGILNAGNGPTPSTYYNINIKGNWTNNNFPTGFVPGTARVRFNGASHQIIESSENFNLLEANMGNALRIQNAGHTVTCNTYDWTTGGIDVIAGTFTALDLFDSGLFGSFWVNPGATINLTQDASQYVDLNGLLNFNVGGTINVYGGSSTSWWPFAGNATINMNGGVLDFKDQGIYIRNSGSYTFTQNISGGTIRTSGGLSIVRTDFTPVGGLFEFYGSADRLLDVATGSHLRYVNVNKSSKAQQSYVPAGPEFDPRDGRLLGDGSKANNLSLGGYTNILHDLTITAGSLTLNGFELTVGGTCDVYGTLNVTNAADIMSVGQNYGNYLRFFSGSTGNLLEGTVNIFGWIWPLSGSTFNTTTNNSVVLKGAFGGGLATQDPAAAFGNVVVQKNSGQWACIDLSNSVPVTVNGTFTVSPGSIFYIQNKTLTVNGTFTDASTSEIYMANVSKNPPEGSFIPEKEPINTTSKGGSLTINSDYYINGLLDLADGDALLTQGFGINSTGILKINGGSFINNRPDINWWTDIKGSLQLSSGLFELTHNHPNFFSGSSSVISGGTFRIGGAFYATDPDVFKPTGGVVEITGDNYNGAVYCYNGNYFHNLSINRTDLYSQFMGGQPVQINNDFTVNQGIMATASSLVSVSGNLTINNGGVLNVGAGGGVAMGPSRAVTVNNGGSLEFNGASGNQAKMTRIASGNYAMNVESGATIGADHTIFEFMNTNGVNIKSGANVDPAKSFNHCIFRNGQSGGRMLTINNSQTFAVNYATFPNNTWGGNFNVYKSVNAGMVTFGGHSGLFSGSTNEFDPFSRIHWGGEVASNVSLQGVDIGFGQDICYDATNTLTIAGGGTTFLVQNGGSSNLIAGQRIRLLEGTTVLSGGYLLARISTEYCTLPPPMMGLEEIVETTYEETVPVKSSETSALTETGRFFKAWPNPTNDRVNLEFSDPTVTFFVEVFGMVGERILAKEVSGFSLYELDLAGQPKGVYVVRVSDGYTVAIERIIKN